MTPQNRRKHKRYPVAITAAALTHTPSSHTVTIIDLSYEGLRITAPSHTIATLIPRYDSRDYQHTRMTVRFDLTLANGERSPVQLLCRIAHLHVLEHTIELGLEHRDIEEGIEALSRYLLDR